MSRAFSLGGAAFCFHCVAPAERRELAALLLRHGGVLYDAKSARRPDVVYVIADYWADCALAVSGVGELRPVTRFWLAETLRLERWLRPDAHPFFEPPPRPSDLRLQYPAGFQDAPQDAQQDADGDVRMQDPAAGLPGHRMRLPCSPSFLFRGQVPLWPYVAAYLAQPIRDAHELTARLQLYGTMTMSDPRRRFNCLEYAVNELLTDQERTKFFQTVLPEMARLVLAMPQMFATPPPLLTPLETRDEVEENAPTVGEDRVEASTIGNSGQVVTQSHRLTKLEVLTLVCGCFFGIFPDQDIAKRTQPQIGASNRKAARRGSKGDMIQFPYFTAVRMFSAPGNMGRMVVLKGQKIRCLLQYFMRVVPRVISDRASMLSEVIDFTRVSVHLPSAQGPIPSDQPPQELLKLIATVTDCSNTVDQAQTNGEVLSSLRLYPAQCVSDTLIEDLDEHLQIDFANKFAGGGVLNAGCVQEEIRFLLSPELLVSCLVFAKLEPHEAFVIHGTERYSAYQGYGGSFVYGGNFEDTIRMKVLSDGSLRRECVIVGIDATDYGSSRVDRQYTRGHVWRDLVKAYVGFAYPDAHDEHRCWPVATGNWGCGVFQGDRELKFMIQWLAASLRRRELVYVLFERDLDLQTKVNPLLKLATSPKAREWDRQSGGLLQWFVAFLFDELNADREMRREQSVLGRAAASLERTLSALNLAGGKQTQECSKQAAGSPQGSPLIAAENNQEPLAIVRHPDQADKEGSAGLKKKPKTTKGELHQKTMQDFFSPK